MWDQSPRLIAEEGQSWNVGNIAVSRDLAAARVIAARPPPNTAGYSWWGRMKPGGF